MGIGLMVTPQQPPKVAVHRCGQATTYRVNGLWFGLSAETKGREVTVSSSRRRTCPVCGAWLNDETPVTPHVWDADVAVDDHLLALAAKFPEATA